MPSAARLLLPATPVLTTYYCRYYFFSELESRLYAHASTEADSRCGASVVRDEIIEVEVEEGGKTEWRRALVGRILPGGRGRFQATVFHPDGTLDDDFVEIFSAAQVILHGFCRVGVVNLVAEILLLRRSAGRSGASASRSRRRRRRRRRQRRQSRRRRRRARARCVRAMRA